MSRIRTVHQVAALLAILASVFGTLPARAADTTLTDAVLTHWLEGYKAAWETRDADKAAALFTAAATYQDEAFSPPYVGTAGIKGYWSKVTAGQRDVKFQYQVLGVTGNTGIAHWSAQFAVAGTPATIALDGVFLLEFDASGKCRSLREWWHLKSTPPPPAQ